MSMEVPPLEPSPKTGAGDNTFRFLVNVLGDYWALILSGALGGALLVGCVSWLLHEVALDKYESMAEVRIMPSPWEKGLLGEIGGVTLTSTPTALVNRTNLATLAEEVAFALVQVDIQEGGPLSRTATKQDMQQLAGQLEGKLRLQPFDDQQKIRISVSNCPSKKEAENIAEYATRVLLAQHRQLETSEHQAQHDYLKQELERLGQQLRESTAREWEYKQQIGFRNFGQVDESMAKTQDDLDKLQATKKETEAKLAELESELIQNTTQLPEALGHINEDAVTGMKQELDKLLQEKLSMSVVWQPEYEGIQALDADIDDQKTAILDAISQLDNAAGGSSNIWKRRQDIYRQQMELRVSLTSDEVRIASLQRMLKEIIPKIPELANENQRIVELEQETERTRKLFQEFQVRETQAHNFDAAEHLVRARLEHRLGFVQRRKEVLQWSVPSQNHTVKT